MSLVTWYREPEVRRIVGRLQEVVERVGVEISRYIHADVSFVLSRRMRSAKFTGVARWTGSDVTRRASPCRRAVVKRALELRSRNDVYIT